MRAVREQHDFGALFGVDVRFSNGWTCRLDLTMLDPDDREFAFGIHRFF